MKKSHKFKFPRGGTKSATVVIGSGFGDEGKGLLTDWAAAPAAADCLVARFNGGVQAGHTVVLPDGRRHIHSHYGSGTLAGAATFLSRYFVSNPLLFRRETAVLQQLEIELPAIFADERGFISTPFDMLINQIAEKARGKYKHGSCGVGFGETIERCESENFATRLADLADVKKFATILEQIRKVWVPFRLSKLGIANISSEYLELIDAADLTNDYLAASNQFYHSVSFARPDILTTAKRLVFEGAQGLLLDQESIFFPHVTRSFTGLRNAVELAEEAGITDLQVIYATRAYATRHGAGPLPCELPALPYAKITDLTNIPNPYQDSLRFGWLDLDLLKNTIDTDFQRYSTATSINIERHLAITLPRSVG